MKIHSLQSKFLITVLSSILAITVFIGGLSIYEIDHFTHTQTQSLIHATSENEATQINDIFGSIEKSVRIMESYVLDLIESRADIKDHHKQDEIIAAADRMFATVAKNTNGATGYYLRLDPAISDQKAGLFYSKLDGSNHYIRLESTDLSLYDKDDTEHVGWFWEPYGAHKPVWMKPYHNKNNDIVMISYVIPLYFEDQFIGIIGMDFDYTVLTDRVHQIKIYENDFAHLEMDGSVICHNDDDSSIPSSDLSEEYLQVSRELINGMTLVLSASRSDIHQIHFTIVSKILFAALLLAALFSLIVTLVVRRIVRPLKILTEASRKLSDGNYDVEIVQSNTYEIKLLSAAFENMIVHLRKHEKQQRRLAYRDSLTGLRNTTAYKEWVTDFNKELKIDHRDFGVIVFDLNYLKETNDGYGHDSGNKLIIAASKVIADTFKRSPVFRIGGDEFVAILQNSDLENCEYLLMKFELKCKSRFIKAGEKLLGVSIAKGFARYNPAHDTQFLDVFNRADDAMYLNKKEMKTRYAKSRR